MSRNEEFFHGTVHHLNVGDSVLPAAAGGAPTIHGESDPRFSYATTQQGDAWEYAAMAHEQTEGEEGPPRVYRVSPLGRHSKDPEYTVEARPEHRGNFGNDRRSKAGWRVESEQPLPPHMHGRYE